MPYYRHPKVLGENQPEDYPAFATMPEARKGMNLATETVTFVPTDNERERWYERERSRFGDIYTPVPWIADRNRVFYIPYDDSEGVTTSHTSHSLIRALSPTRKMMNMA